MDTVVFDKTGTLTLREFTVDHVEKYQVLGEYVLQMAWAESMSRHPIALSIVEAWGGEFDPCRRGLPGDNRPQDLRDDPGAPDRGGSNA